MKIPKDIEQKVVSKLYTDARRLEWASLTPQQRSAQYAKWIIDSEVGGRLREYLSDAATRVWIKDGPMKEWSRSASGVGKYSAMVAGAEDVPQSLVLKTLGDDWEADKSTIRAKPLRIVARRAEEETVVTWGASRDLKHLVWAALTAEAEGDLRPWVICLVETFTRPTPANERVAQALLADRCGLRLVYVTL